MKPRVLFLCTGNSARSQIAEALTRHYAGNHFDVYSAGLEPHGINPYTVRVLEEIDIDISDQRSKGVDEYLGQIHFEYLITVCSHAEENCPTTFLGFGHKLHWDLEDPAAMQGSDEAKLTKFREIRDEITTRVHDWIAALGI